MTARVLDSFRRIVSENLRFALHRAPRAQAARVPHDGRHRHRRLDRHRDGRARDRLRPLADRGVLLVRHDARAVPEVRAALRPGPPLRGGAQAQGPHDRGRARRSRALCPSILAVSPERYMWSASQVKGNGNEANSPADRRRQPGLRDLQQLGDPGRAQHHGDRRRRTRRTCAVDRPGRLGGALQGEGPARRRSSPSTASACRSSATFEQEGLLGLRRPARQHRHDPDLDVRPALPADEELARRHDPHRDDPAVARARRPRHRGGHGRPAGAAQGAVQRAERLRDLHGREDARADAGRHERDLRRHGPHRGDRARRGRRRRHEHHARLGDGADEGDRPAQGARRAPAGHLAPVPDGGDDADGARRRRRRRPRAPDGARRARASRACARRRRSGASSSGSACRSRSASSSGSTRR